jgi:hypothetical protein
MCLPHDPTPGGRLSLARNRACTRLSLTEIPCGTSKSKKRELNVICTTSATQRIDMTDACVDRCMPELLGSALLETRENSLMWKAGAAGKGALFIGTKSQFFCSHTPLK